ncbi:MAG TPA: hypothetical protein VL123_08790 [Candidatus Udaeobacter sp.]|jgi:hypothetical protein|nr:hypothetical protein [Candidatus Udaeobacter sp.]
MDDARPARMPGTRQRSRDLISALPFYGMAAGLVFSGALLDALRLPPDPIRSGAVAVIGVGIGALTGEIARRRLRSAMRGPRMLSARRPGMTGAATIQVVGAPSLLLPHAACEVLAPFLARGERVLMLDVTRDGGAEPAFAAPSRWGLDACLNGAVPLLGAVRASGVPGLHLVPRGASYAPVRAEVAACASLLDQAQRHFSRVILVIDGASPWLGAAAARRLEAWWLSPAVRKPGEIIGMPPDSIPWVGLKLKPEPRRPLEVLAARVDGYRGAARLVAAGRSRRNRLRASPEVHITEPHPLPASPRHVAPVSSLDPVRMNGDSRTRERLRFLIWMRALGRDPEARAGAGEPRRIET